MTLKEMLVSDVPVLSDKIPTESRPVAARAMGICFAALSTNEESLKHATVDVQTCPRNDKFILMDGNDGRANAVSEYRLDGAAGYDAAGVVLRAICSDGEFETARGIAGMQLLEGLAILWLREQERLATESEE